MATDPEQRLTGVIDGPAIAPAQPAFANDPSSAGGVLRAVERSATSQAGGSSVDESTAGASREPAELLTQTNQQLELIRQTLEKILAKPGSVVLD